MSTTDKILKEMEQMSKGGEGSGQKGHKTESNQESFDRKRALNEPLYAARWHTKK